MGICGIQKMYSQVTTIEAEIRPRTEFREGFRKPLADTLNPGIITLQRSRLNADYKSKILNARLSIQDSRIWGNSDNKTNASKIELNEAWAELLIFSGFSAQIGRQGLGYDDKRLFSPSGWSNTGIAHDAMVLKYSSPLIDAHAGIAYNNVKDTLLDISYTYTAKQNYKMLNYLWLSKEVYKGLTLSAIGVCDYFQNSYAKNKTNLYPRLTYGGNLGYITPDSKLNVYLTYYGQGGSTPNKNYSVKTKYADLAAYMYAAKVSYSFTDKITTTIGFEKYSGSDYSTYSTSDSMKSHTFERLYGATHSFNGSMEYFSTLPTQGLKDLYFGLTGKIGPKLLVDLTVHSFSFDKDFYYSKVKTEKNLGTEADLTISYNASKEISFQCGYSMYFNSGSTAKYYKMAGVETHTQQWAYVMLTIKPQLYKTPAPAESK